MDHFRGGIPTVIANLDRLYRDIGFRKALETYGPKVEYFHNGAGKYGASQKEVVLELGTLSSTHVFSYGGFSGSLEDLESSFFLEHGRRANKQEKAQIFDLVGKPWWLSEEATWKMLARAVANFEKKISAEMKQT